MMNKAEFEKGYCERSFISLEQYRRWKVTMPCECDSEDCEGWAAILNEPAAIAHQKEFCSPKD